MFAKKAILVKGRAYVINVGEYKSKGTHWIDLEVNDKNAAYSKTSLRIKYHNKHLHDKSLLLVVVLIFLF